MKNKNNILFPFITDDSIITFEETNINIEANVNTNDKKYKEKLYYIYDKQSDRFITFFESNISIYNSKGELEKKTKINLNERIKLVAVEYNCNFLLLLTKSNQGIISNFESHENYNIFDRGDFIGGFFIRRDEKKDPNFCKLCMVSRNDFIISKIFCTKTMKGKFKFQRKSVYNSKIMQINNYYYNSISNVVIFRTYSNNFVLVNLKSSVCIETLISLDHINTNNIMDNSLFMVRNIYHRFYFINMNSKIIEFYGLKNLKNKKQPKIINLESNFSKIKLQFTNNLVLIFSENSINIYDIKSKNNNKILTINYTNNNDYIKFFKEMKICGDFIAIGNKFYRTKFNSEIYLKNRTKEDENERFLVTLRRNGFRNIILKFLINLLQNLEISKLYQFLSIIIKYNSNTEKVFTPDKNNPYQLSFCGLNYFYINSDEIFSIFSRKLNNINPIKIVQFMGVIYSLYKQNKIQVDDDIFISTVYFHLNQIHKFTSLESMLRNGLIPLNYQLGMFLVDKTIYHNIQYSSNNDKNMILEYGIQNLMEKKDEGIYEIVKILFTNNKDFECFDMVSNYLYEKYYQNIGKYGKIKNFVNEKLGLSDFFKSENTNEEENQISENKEDVEKSE